MRARMASHLRGQARKTRHELVEIVLRQRCCEHGGGLRVLTATYLPEG